MATQGRRDFLKSLSAIGISTIGVAGITPSITKASPENILSKDRMGVLVDTTVCIGCRKCEWACKNAHDMPSGSIDEYENESVFDNKRRPDYSALTVINKYQNDKTGSPINVKVQCMHCDQPACVSACIVGAFSKKENGSVVWDESKCIGCRYCMVACPFQIPSFDYHKALEPEIRKCDFCFDRTAEGKLPACIEICPVEAITYGRREDLVQVAQEKIKNYPERYNNHILGETEVGGTSWMYMAGVDFKNLDFPTLGDKSAPGVSESIQHGIFSYFVPPVALYALLGGVMWISKNRDKKEEN